MAEPVFIYVLWQSDFSKPQVLTVNGGDEICYGFYFHLHAEVPCF